jgi:glutathione synthase/RimK-type ligase-like ATP-grasp enzyme
MRPDSCCILNGGGGAWAFATLAQQLSNALWVEVSDAPRQYNYLLAMDDFDASVAGELFIPLRCLELAADKRRLAEVFAARSIPTPETHLVHSLEDAERIMQENLGRDWCLKYPTSCGATGHCMLAPGMTLPKDWPRPLVVQEFIRLERPEVFRLYGAGGHVFGWVARRFPAGAKISPWVAHARGARYELAGEAPGKAISVGQAALEAVGLLNSFGCVDLLRRPSGEWLVLEVGTDGLFNHVDRDLGCPELEREILRRIAESFWGRLGWRPWAAGAWFPQQAIAV